MFGDVDRRSGKYFGVQIDEQIATILVLQYILQELTEIISSGWSGYFHMENLEGIFHEFCCYASTLHCRSIGVEVQVQNMENLWMCAKHKLKGNLPQLLICFQHSSGVHVTKCIL